MDDCGREGEYYKFCQCCLRDSRAGKIPKFSAKNQLTPGFCQDYPTQLKGLTAVEECAIALSRPFGLIMKLRPMSAGTALSYHALRGHMIVMPQDPGKLLEILPSSELRFEEHIKVVWTHRDRPTMEDLRPWLRIRKSVVLEALRYLHGHNHLYQNIRLNDDLLSQWPDEFIPETLIRTATTMEPESCQESTRHGYSTVGAALDEEDYYKQGADHFNSGCVYSDVNGMRKQTIPDLLDVVRENLIDQNISRRRPFESTVEGVYQAHEEHVIRFNTKQGSPRNDYDDPAYFTSAFPTLFWDGTGGHFSKRKRTISLEEWAKWLCKHHSRR